MVEVIFDRPAPDILIGKIGNVRIIRSGYLGSVGKLRKMIEFVDWGRISIVQYNIEEEEWGKMTQEHQSLLRVNPQLAHLSLPERPPFYQKPSREETYREKEIADILPKLMNMEAWARYSSWLNENFEKAANQFHRDAADEYTLEARFGDFKHEVFSDLLVKNLEEIRQIDISLAKKHAQGIYEGTLEEEKQLIRLRESLHRMIEAQYAILGDIVTNIQSLEREHPELIKIEEMSLILQRLLQNQLVTLERPILSWGLQEMLLQLLDEALGVQPVLNCSQDQGRTFFAFALRLTALQLKQKHSIRDIIQGIPQMMPEIRALVYENLKSIRDIVHTKEHVKTDLIPNPDIFEFLPPNHEGVKSVL